MTIMLMQMYQFSVNHAKPLNIHRQMGVHLWKIVN
jgi:hypothetical protein